MIGVWDVGEEMAGSLSAWTAGKEGQGRRRCAEAIRSQVGPEKSRKGEPSAEQLATG